MLTKRHCTATGVINFFAKQEPHIAVGSVVPGHGRVKFVWHYHGAVTHAEGTAFDLTSVEQALNEQHRRERLAAQNERRAA